MHHIHAQHSTHDTLQHYPLRAGTRTILYTQGICGYTGTRRTAAPRRLRECSIQHPHTTQYSTRTPHLIRPTPSVRCALRPRRALFCARCLLRSRFAPRSSVPSRCAPPASPLAVAVHSSGSGLCGGLCRGDSAQRDVPVDALWMPCAQLRALHCTALHCTALHCTAATDGTVPYTTHTSTLPPIR